MSKEQQGQLWTEYDLLPTVADRCIDYFISQYLDGACTCDDGQLSREMDEAGHAVLLLCEEYQESLTIDHIPRIKQCCDVMTPRYMAQLDCLAWSSCLNLRLSSPNLVNTIRCYFNHGQSSVRMFSFEVGWFVRRHLPPDECAPSLLKNVADTLGYWAESIALCASLFPDMESFWTATDVYEPEEDFTEQYRNRIARVKDLGISVCRVPFLYLDSTIRKRVMDCSMMLRCK